MNSKQKMYHKNKVEKIRIHADCFEFLFPLYN